MGGTMNYKYIETEQKRSGSTCGSLLWMHPLRKETGGLKITTKNVASPKRVSFSSQSFSPSTCLCLCCKSSGMWETSIHSYHASCPSLSTYTHTSFLQELRAQFYVVSTYFYLRPHPIDIHIYGPCFCRTNNPPPFSHVPRANIYFVLARYSCMQHLLHMFIFFLPPSSLPASFLFPR